MHYDVCEYNSIHFCSPSLIAIHITIVVTSNDNNNKTESVVMYVLQAHRPTFHHPIISLAVA